ncbi:hypothetical protein EDD29_5732 [Actinocorallia herbida]|uniref:Uncharacterized protein n=1 Tax=Actinocorallia herbida TaxID=58109 RepID=A0A3N1D3H7_9ACTN|nr:hypothetical protein [Actinocorallia herbida]ROO88075.1 hypothetical protein EDD29_5732 [Actinocorallia herbida]
MVQKNDILHALLADISETAEGQAHDATQRARTASRFPRCTHGDTAQRFPPTPALTVRASAAEPQAVMRTFFTNLLANGPRRLQAIIDREELDRLFTGRADEVDWSDLAPRLLLFDGLEQVIEHLEGEFRGGGDASMDGAPRMFWFTTPGPDHDVVLRTLEPLEPGGFVGVLLGLEPHGPAVYAFDRTSHRSRRRFRGPAAPCLLSEDAAILLLHQKSDVGA